MALLGHTADWHIHPDGARPRLDPETGLNARLMDYHRCARFTVEDAIERGAELIIHCGDFGQQAQWSPTVARLVKQALEPAREAGIEVVALLGNHDMPRNPADLSALDYLREVAGLHLIEQPCVLDVWRTGQGKLRVSPPGAEGTDGAELQLACLPFPKRQLILRDEEVRGLDPAELNILIREKMMDVARGLAAQRAEGLPRLLLGHFSVDLAEAGTQNRLMALGGDWTLNAHELAALDFDAVLLGHIHKAQRLEQYPMWYCGSPEACTFGEEGEFKFYNLIGLEGRAKLTQQIVGTPYRRFLTLSADDFIFEGGKVTCPLDVTDAIVRLEIPPDASLTPRDAHAAFEEAGAFDARVTVARGETVRRREVAVSHQMELPEAVRAWIEQKPDLSPLADDLIAEAMRVEAALKGEEGGAE